MDKLKKERRIQKLNLSRIKAQMDEICNLRTVDIENLSKLESLMSMYFRPQSEKFETLTDNMLMMIDEEDPAQVQFEEQILKDLSELRNIGASIQGKIKSFHSKLSTAQSRQSVVPGTSILDQSFSCGSGNRSFFPKLKEIEPPKFSGDLAKFFEWKNLFVNLVHENKDLTNVQKLFYLNKSLTGEAEGIISDFEMSDEAYPEAWSHVLGRFEKRRSIVRALFRNLKNLESIKSERGIQKLLDSTNAIIRGLKAAGEVVNDTFSRFIAYYISTKLDVTTAKDWENSLSAVDSFPKFEQLNKFLQCRAFSVEDRVRDAEQSISLPSSTAKGKLPDKKSFTTAKNAKCSCCLQNHRLYQCTEFKAKKPQDRYNIVKKNRLCLICFEASHGVPECKSKYRCSCGKNHNQLLHFEFKSPIAANISPNSLEIERSRSDELETKTTSESNPSGYETKKSMSCAQESLEKVVLLPSAVVKFKCGNIAGKARIILDSCSQPTLVADSFVRKFRLPTVRSGQPFNVKGVALSTIPVSSSVELMLFSRVSSFNVGVVADIVPAESIAYSANVTLPSRILDGLKLFPLADPCCADQNVAIKDIDLVIGAEYYETCICNQSCTLNSLTLRLTHFGWTISGAAPTLARRETRYSGLTTQEIDRHMEKFWEIEEAGPQVSAKSIEADQCEKHFLKTFSFAVDGKFNVKLPFKIDRMKIASNRSRALASLVRVERTLDAKTKADYVDFMRQYLSMGHMTLVPPTTQPVYYIPHREIIRTESSTTPLRVVFNASSKGKGEISLNDALMTGPVIQRDLFDILISMRSFAVVFCADIAKMYRMIWVDKADRCMQRILWRESPLSPVKEYELNTITYGTAPASFIATRCLQEISRSLKESNPTAAAIIEKQFYMDDLIVGGDSNEGLISLQRTIHSALAGRGFELRKYSSNSKELLRSIAPELRAISSPFSLGEERDRIAVLGTSWDPQADTFCIKLNIESFVSTAAITKRTMLSYISRTFDPLGFVSPVTIRGKLLLQSLWMEGRSWDAPVTQETSSSFVNYMADLKKLSSFVIHRPICELGNVIDRHLIAFCDASEKAYCVVLYFRAIDDCSNVSCRMVCSKTRVAPIRRALTIPKLELKAAEMLSVLVPRVAVDLKIDLKNVFAFSDSTIVLCWLSRPGVNWKTFVCNHVQKTVNVIPFAQWCYVTSEDNPADLGTRGLDVSEFVDNQKWVGGPSFLLERNAFSFHVIPNLDVHNALEKRKTQTVLHCIVVDSFIEKYSCLVRLVHVVAYMYRFIRRAKLDTVSINSSEFCNALNVVTRMSQKVWFQVDIDRLRGALPLKKKSSLISLDPFIDQDGLLRVGGRIQNSKLPYATRHPIIISAKSHFAKLLCRYLHNKYFHVGRNFLASFLAAKYWIVGGRTNLLKFVIRSCVNCARAQGKVAEQLMGRLPMSRVTVSHPFSFCGVDLVGPLMCKCVGHRSVKSYKIYVAVFVCLAVRAVHLEIVSDQSSQKFLDAFLRFVARRGKPVRVHSDNATNFCGTWNFFERIKEEIVDLAAKEGIHWEFIPPRSPNFGGIWEAAVKSTKARLLQVTHGQSLSFEEYTTVLARIEAVLNSRPLCYRKNIEQGSEVLTPGHFLVGESLLTVPLLDKSSQDISPSTRIELMKNQINSFWNVWSKDYLNQVQQRSKWNSKNVNLEVGQVVLVKRKGQSQPFKWPLGKIVAVYPGEDNLVRVADVEYDGTILRRSVSSLVPLPVAAEPLSSAGGSMFTS